MDVLFVIGTMTVHSYVFKRFVIFMGIPNQDIGHVRQLLTLLYDTVWHWEWISKKCLCMALATLGIIFFLLAMRFRRNRLTPSNNLPLQLFWRNCDLFGFMVPLSLIFSKFHLHWHLLTKKLRNRQTSTFHEEINDKIPGLKKLKFKFVELFLLPLSRS